MRTVKSLILIILSTVCSYSQNTDSLLFSIRDNNTIYLQYDDSYAPAPLTYVCKEISKDSVINLIKILEKNEISYFAKEITIIFQNPWNELQDFEKNCYLNAIDNVKDNLYFSNKNYFPESIKVEIENLKPKSSSYDDSHKQFNKLFIYHIDSGSPNIKKFGFISDYDIDRRMHMSDQRKKELDRLYQD